MIISNNFKTRSSFYMSRSLAHSFTILEKWTWTTRYMTPSPNHLRYGYEQQSPCPFLRHIEDLRHVPHSKFPRSSNGTAAAKIAQKQLNSIRAGNVDTKNEWCVLFSEFFPTTFAATGNWTQGRVATSWGTFYRCFTYWATLPWLAVSYHEKMILCRYECIPNWSE